MLLVHDFMMTNERSGNWALVWNLFNTSGVCGCRFETKFSLCKHWNKDYKVLLHSERLYQHTIHAGMLMCEQFVTYHKHTGCNRRNGPDFGRVFLRSNYTDITQNTYIQSWTVTGILAREKSGFLWCLRTVLVSVTSFSPLLELHSYVRANVAPAT